jgi:hypothetical protein
MIVDVSQRPKGESRSLAKTPNDPTATAGSARRAGKRAKLGESVAPAIGLEQKPRISRIELACWGALLAAAVGARISLLASNVMASSR